VNKPLPRRDFIQRVSVCGAAVVSSGLAGGAESPNSRRKMKLSLSPGAIGVKAAPRELVALAQKHGFEAVEPNPTFLAGLGEAELQAFVADVKSRGLVFGAAGLTVDFRADDAKFRLGLDGFPRIAAGLKRAGVDRVGTWISPGHNELTYIENFRQHATRLREVSRVLKDHGQRLGLEYVGTPSSRRSRKYPFIHCMREMQELIAEIGTGNVGLVLDSWHWWTAGETGADLLKLRAIDVVSVDLNDAPAGLTVEQQLDGKRELSCATGVIPMADFLKGLQRMDFDGPARAEPFNQALNALEDEEACAAVIAALRKAVALWPA
jgi:sugar phosphate isomerase/epimerase